jgi:hypothetical protein
MSVCMVNVFEHLVSETLQTLTVVSSEPDMTSLPVAEGGPHSSHLHIIGLLLGSHTIRN